MIATKKPCAGAIVALALGSIFFAARAGEQKTTAKPTICWYGQATELARATTF